MTKNTRRILSGCLTLTAVLGCMMPAADHFTSEIFETVTVNAEDVIKGKCGAYASFEYDPNTMALVISGSGELYEDAFYADGNRAEPYYKKIKSVVINGDISKIGKRTFGGCTQIQSVKINSAMTEIGSKAFYQCSSLESINLPDSIGIIGLSAFYSCFSLTKVTLPSNLSYINDETFYGCSSLEHIYIHDKIFSVGSKAFMGCSSLSSVYVSSKLESIKDSAFSGCKKLISISLYEGLKDIGDYAFNGTGLKSVVLPASLNRIGNSPFINCSDLTEIYVESGNKYFRSTNDILYSNDYSKVYQYAPGKKAKNVTLNPAAKEIANYAFSSNRYLTEIFIPSGLEKIKNYAFSNCVNLNDIYYEGSESQWKTVSWDTFDNMSSIPSNIKIHYGILSGSCGAYANYVYDDKTKTLIISGIGSVSEHFFDSGSSELSFLTEIKKVVINEGITQLKDGAFRMCGSIETAELPDSLTYIGNNAFQNCIELKGISIPSGVSYIGSYAFDYSGIQYVNIPDKVTTIKEGTFMNCLELSKVTSGNKITAIEDYAFYNCQVLDSFTLPDTLKTIGDNAFENCFGFKSCSLSDSVESIGRYSFQNCKNLTTFEIGKSLTSIGFGSFFECYDLTTLTVDSENTKYCLYDGDLYSKDMKKFELAAAAKKTRTLIIPYGVTVLDSGSLNNFKNLITITIPSTVKTIGKNTFNSELKNNLYTTVMNYSGSASDMLNMTIGSNNDAFGTMKINTDYSPLNAARLALYSDGTFGIEFLVDKGFDVMINGEKCKMTEQDGKMLIKYASSAKDTFNSFTITYYGQSKTMRIIDLIRQYKNSSVYTGKLKSLIDSINTYCTAAKDYFAGNMVDDQNAAVNSDFDSEVIDKKTGGLHYEGSTLLLKSRIVLRHYFKLDQGDSIENYIIKIKNADIDRSRLEEMEIMQAENGLYYVELGGQSAVSLGDKYEITVYPATSRIASVKLNACALSYCNKVINASIDDSDLVNLCKALYNYYYAAVNYTNS